MKVNTVFPEERRLGLALRDLRGIRERMPGGKKGPRKVRAFAGWDGLDGRMIEVGQLGTG